MCHFYGSGDIMLVVWVIVGNVVRSVVRPGN